MNENSDEYLTVSAISEGFFKEKGSKFLAFAIPCNNKESAKTYIESFRKEHHNACHVCFAWRFGTNRFEDRYSDDGEPNNSAGKPIFGQILSFDLTNVLIAVVRYYGGTNLGVGGLINAYRTAAKEALKNSNLQKKYVSTSFKLQHQYDQTGIVMGILNKLNAQILKQSFENDLPLIEFHVRASYEQHVKTAFEKYNNITLIEKKN